MVILNNSKSQYNKQEVAEIPLIVFLRLLIAGIFLFTFYGGLYGQTPIDPVVSQGIIPDDFLLRPQEKSKLLYRNIEQDTIRWVRKRQEEFYRYAPLVTDYIYRSGEVYFNNELNDYVNRIAGYLLRDHPELKEELSFYIIRDPDFNAFATSEGKIFIHIGLLAQVENEAQLAYVMAHEIAHVIKGHALDAYIERGRAGQGREEYRKLSYDQRILAVRNYSREQELEADREAMQGFMLNSEYAADQCSEVLLHMLQTLVPGRSQQDIIDFLESETLPLTAFSIPETVDSFAIEEFYSDSLSTHPNIGSRRSGLDSILQSGAIGGDAHYIVSEEEFYAVRNKAALELAHIYLQSTDYMRAILHSRSLLSNQQEREFAGMIRGVALAQLADYKTHDDYFYLRERIEGVPGPIGKLRRLFDEMSDTALCAFALVYNSRLKEEFPGNLLIDSLIGRIVHNLVATLGVDRQAAEALVALPDNFSGQALALCINDPKIRNHFRQEEEACRKEKQYKEELIRNDALRKQIAKENKIIRKRGFALGIDRIVIVNPQVVFANLHYDKEEELEKAEDIRYELISLLRSTAADTDLELQLLDIKSMTDDGVEAYNDYCMLSGWFNEKCLHYSDEYVPYSSLYVQEMADRYGTKYFAWTGIVQVNDESVKSRISRLEFYLFDITTGQVLLKQAEWIGTGNAGAASTRILEQVKNRRLSLCF